MCDPGGFCVPVATVGNNGGTDAGVDVEPDVVCDDPGDPPVDLCGDEEGTTAVFDDAGCFVNWECTPPVCNEPTQPTCDAGDHTRAIENSAGCITLVCRAATT